MGKIILLAIAVWLLITILKRYRNSVQADRKPASSDENMVRCAHCGVHLPTSDSILVEQRHYCSLEHSQRGQHD